MSKPKPKIALRRFNERQVAELEAHAESIATKTPGPRALEPVDEDADQRALEAVDEDARRSPIRPYIEAHTTCRSTSASTDD